MTDEQIFKKAIEIVTKKGWEPSDGFVYIVKPDLDNEPQLVGKSSDHYDCWQVSLREVLFGHDFLKAFFGDIWTDKEMDDDKCWHAQDIAFLKPWQYHGQQMLLEKQPLKYLEKFL